MLVLNDAEEREVSVSVVFGLLLKCALVANYVPSVRDGAINI